MKNRIGKEFQTNSGICVIMEYKLNTDVTVQFNDGTQVKTCMSQLETGNVKNPNHPSIKDKGFLGVGKYNRTNNLKIYKVWCAMLIRCYDANTQKNQPTYIGCTVCEEWHSFQNFAAWFEENYVEGWHLDKDIICKDCRIYSPKTCAFVPREINNLFLNCKNKSKISTGITYTHNKYNVMFRINYEYIYLGRFSELSQAEQIYKEAKKQHAIKLAEKFKDSLDERVYNSLCA